MDVHVSKSVSRYEQPDVVGCVFLGNAVEAAEDIKGRKSEREGEHQQAKVVERTLRLSKEREPKPGADYKRLAMKKGKVYLTVGQK
jgi:hypothetical protein